VSEPLPADRQTASTPPGESTARFHLVASEMNMALSHAVEGIARLDEQGRYIFVNEAYAQTVGYSIAEMIGMEWEKTVYPEDLEMVTAHYQDMLRNGKVELEARGIRKDASVFHKRLFMVTAYASLPDGTAPGPQITGHYCFMKDISERKKQEAEQQKAEADLLQSARKIREQAALLDIASDAIFVRDLNHKILYWNQGAERLYGWSAAEAIGQPANELLQEDREQISNCVRSLLEQGEWRGEMQKVTKTGQVAIVEGRWTLVRDEAGQPKSILVVNTDITEKKQRAEQYYQAQRLESLGTLASGIAHDLNNTLTPILALSQLIRLQQQNLDAKSQEMLKVIETSAQRGAEMVQQILTFTRGTGGKRIDVELMPILREAIEIMRKTFPPSIEIHEKISDQPLWLVSADPTQLHQVLMNLGINARDAMPNGGKLLLSVENFYVDELFARTVITAKVGSYVLITIADNGTGIPAEVCDRIFEPFFTTKAHGSGTGLGLSTVLGIVKSYGGFVQVISQPGQGSQFKVYLPKAPASATATI
jgi:PAS domain S-box-containing protein